MSDVFVPKASLSLYYVKQYLEVDQVFFQPAADRVFCFLQETFAFQPVSLRFVLEIL